MGQPMVEVPDDLMPGLRDLAARRRTSVEGLALEQLSSLVEGPAGDLGERYERFLRESGLFVKRTASGDQPVSRERLEQLADKLAAAGPLSEVIIDKRGTR